MASATPPTPALPPPLSAAVAWREAEALAEAAAADARLAAARADAPSSTAPPLPPFLGVPCSVKESIAVAGCRLTSGLASRRDAPPSAADATAVGRLRAAGLIPICSTNVSELCMWLESSNTVYGRTDNAYDPHRGVGGSSGGEGALLSAGGAPVGVGADVGGSIRIPAAFNGVFGHKPTGGLIPNTGQVRVGGVRRSRLAFRPSCTPLPPSSTRTRRTPSSQRGPSRWPPLTSGRSSPSWPAPTAPTPPACPCRSSP